jgi:site-specific recombinase XerD
MDIGHEEATKTIKGVMAKIDNDPAYLKENKQTVKDYVAFMEAKALNSRTIAKNLYCFATFLKSLDSNAKLLEATKEEIEYAVAKINKMDYADKTKANIKISIKSFYKHFLGDDFAYPRQVAWIKSKQTKGKVLPKDLLSEQEVFRMLEAANNLRDKAIIALLFDSGIRAGELLSMKKKDIELSTTPNHITVDGKTGMRQIPIMMSAPYLAQYLNTLKDRKPDDPLWYDLGTWNKKNWTPEHGAIRMMLKRVAKKAGIEKRIYSHLFRHSRASYYANMLTDAQLKTYFGWTGDSRMIGTYVHLTGKDIDGAVMQANGMAAPIKKTESELKAKECPKCRLSNGVDAIYCTRCGSPMNIRTAMEEEKNKKTLTELLIEALKDPKAFDEVSKALLNAK